MTVVVAVMLLLLLLLVVSCVPFWTALLLMFLLLLLLLPLASLLQAQPVYRQEVVETRAKTNNKSFCFVITRKLMTDHGVVQRGYCFHF